MVGRLESWAPPTALQDGELMAQGEDLEVKGAVIPRESDLREAQVRCNALLGGGDPASDGERDWCDGTDQPRSRRAFPLMTASSWPAVNTPERVRLASRCVTNGPGVKGQSLP